MSGDAVTLADIEAAAARLAGRVRRTPLLAAAPLRRAPAVELGLKLENLQVTGSFKARGATNRVLTLPPDRLAAGVVTASGGNHGLGLAYAAATAGVPATVYLPHGTPAEKAARLEAWGARVVTEGAVWDDAYAAALTAAAATGATFVHPFADPAVIAGQGTIALEVLADWPAAEALVVAIGGGGLISGVALAAKALRPEIAIIGVEPVGAPTLSEALAAGRPVRLPTITTRAGTLAPRETAPLNLALVRRFVDRMVLVDDGEMAAAARLLWFELGIAAELSGAAAVAAVLAPGRLGLPAGARVCALVCGAGRDGLSEAAV